MSKQDNNASGVNAVEVMRSSQAWNGEEIECYPAGQPELTVMRLSLPANTSLTWHTHPMPNAAFVLSGTLIVEDKQSGEQQTFKAGEALNETVNSAHRGFTLDQPAELVITYAGVKGQQLTEPLPGEPEEF
ncbi:quercetin dioxygenase-like cupin family protein [Pantoea sp. AN62]|uniref:cupin domain-containing protein n=1 Tax=Pantoea TaxID=53335 RepID=UPI000B7F64C2|nr:MULTISPECIES: cupin domain-containing protein [Pantoea]MCQ5471148.1 cupin domain-containing protein [Pantoea brenneri]MDU4747947.1 cupin domain-containing protein [Pantoea sp.]OXM23654.1 cupin [Pantoea sp. AV62]HAI07475.1 cupin [Pantoea sp.]